MRVAGSSQKHQYFAPSILQSGLANSPVPDEEKEPYNVMLLAMRNPFRNDRLWMIRCAGLGGVFLLLSILQKFVKKFKMHKYFLKGFKVFMLAFF